MSTHVVKTDWIEGFSFNANVNDHIVKMDNSDADGGNGYGPTPKPLLLAAVAGCTGIDVVGMLNKMRARFTQLSIEVSGTLTDTVPKVYTAIHVKYRINLAEADRHKMEKAVKLSEENYCGVSIMLQKVCPVTFHIEYIEA